MKNKLSFATIVALGILVGSCTTDGELLNSSAQKENNELNSKKTDNIAISKTTTSPYATDDGVIPPVKPE